MSSTDGSVWLVRKNLPQTSENVPHEQERQLSSEVLGKSAVFHHCLPLPTQEFTPLTLL